MVEYKNEDQLELMDWKEIELNAEQVIRQSRKDRAIAHLMLAYAIKEIKNLGGDTNAEINAKAKKANENTTK